MPIPRKTAAEYAAELETAILSRNSSYDTRIGPIPDLIINPVSAVLELQNERIRSVQQLLSLVNDGSFTDADVDAFVYNELLVRHRGARARVKLIFSRATAPTSNVTVKANFPVATLPDEETGATVTFVTLAEQTMYAANAASYFNSATQRYELVVDAEAITGGTVGNVGAERITRPLRPLNGFDTVFNRDPATGGTDPETTDDLIRRYYVSLLGSSPAVHSGIKKIISVLYPQVYDTYIVYGADPLNIRSADDGGAVDVYFIGASPVTTTESITFTGGNQVHVLSKQPVMNIVSIPGYVQGLDYVIATDTSGLRASAKARDGVRWLPGGTMPAIGSSVAVTYQYNGLNSTLQNAFDSPERSVPGRNILFKSATRVDIAIGANIKYRSGFNVVTLTNQISNAILALINSYRLGEDVEASDLQLVVRSFSGVDNFIITDLRRVYEPHGIVNDIAIEQFEYARLTSSNLSLTVI
jgi:uncharacterized phage protein gp47/JayE